MIMPDSALEAVARYLRHRYTPPKVMRLIKQRSQMASRFWFLHAQQKWGASGVALFRERK